MVQRVRDHGHTVTGTSTVLETWNGNVVLSRSSTLSANALDVMTDNVVKGYKRLSSHGKIFVNDMERFQSSPAFASGGTLRIQTATNVWSESLPEVWPTVAPFTKGWLPTTDTVLMAQVATAEALAITEAYAGVGAPDVAILTELAELKETLNFLYSPVKAMVKLTQRFGDHLKKIDRIDVSVKQAQQSWDKLSPQQRSKRKPPGKPKYPRFKAGKFTGSDIASAWLAFRYAIMPLIYTFMDVQKLLKKIAEGPRMRATSRAKEKREVDLGWEGAWSANIPYGGSSFKKRFVRSGTATVTSRAGVLYEPSWDLSSLLGFQWNRVPAALYEAIPLSFVADWAWNGSAVYDALTAEFRAQKILGAWVTTKVEYDLAGGTELFGFPGTTVSSHTSAYVDIGKWTRRRSVSQSDVAIKLRPDLNAKRIADGLALIYLFLVTARKH